MANSVRLVSGEPGMSGRCNLPFLSIPWVRAEGPNETLPPGSPRMSLRELSGGGQNDQETRPLPC